MNKDLLKEKVLAMYDVRGIQDYIFKTNKAREVIGASAIVEDIIVEGLKEYVKENAKGEEKKYLVKWKEKEDPKDDKSKWRPSSTNANDAFIKDGSDIQMQVMFIGGGNAYVLFRTGELCSKVNRFLGKYVLDKTYSLNLAIAVVKYTGFYEKDYAEINTRMIEIKARMPQSKPVGALPFMEIDPTTGFPITSKEKFKDKTESLCEESNLKREKLKKVLEEENKKRIEQGKEPEEVDEKIFDNMVSEKGDNSTLAIIHIDGNSLGKRIMGAMENVDGYDKAIEKMRNLSLEINNTFEESFHKMTAYMDEECKKDKKLSKTDNKKYRKIVVAGDDITYICNAKLAIPSVKKFIQVLNSKSSKTFNIFSACAGIAFFNSHFPFSDAYKVAEACCESAKNRAKINPKDNMPITCDEKVGNFFDYQMCTNVNAFELDSYRDKHYRYDGESFIYRPYYVEVSEDNREEDKKNKDLNKDLNNMFKKYSCSLLDEKLNVILDKSFPRSLAKEIRSVIPQGNNEIDKEISFLESRSYTQFSDLKEKKGIYYDACELMDLQLEGDNNNGSTEDQN